MMGGPGPRRDAEARLRSGDDAVRRRPMRTNESRLYGMACGFALLVQATLGSSLGVVLVPASSSLWMTRVISMARGACAKAERTSHGPTCTKGTKEGLKGNLPRPRFVQDCAQLGVARGRVAQLGLRAGAGVGGPSRLAKGGPGAKERNRGRQRRVMAWTFVPLSSALFFCKTYVHRPSFGFAPLGGGSYNPICPQWPIKLIRGHTQHRQSDRPSSSRMRCKASATSLTMCWAGWCCWSAGKTPVRTRMETHLGRKEGCRE